MACRAHEYNLATSGFRRLGVKLMLPPGASRTVSTAGLIKTFRLLHASIIFMLDRHFGYLTACKA
jgi:hypothetical protein